MTEKPFYEPKHPHPLFDLIRTKFKMHSDRELSHLIGVEQSLISRIRSGKLQMSPSVLLAVHEYAGIDIPTIRALIKRQQP